MQSIRSYSLRSLGVFAITIFACTVSQLACAAAPIKDCPNVPCAVDVPPKTSKAPVVVSPGAHRRHLTARRSGSEGCQTGHVCPPPAPQYKRPTKS